MRYISSRNSSMLFSFGLWLGCNMAKLSKHNTKPSVQLIKCWALLYKCPITWRPITSRCSCASYGDCNCKFWGYVAVCEQLYCRCFTVLRLVVAVLHYMFRPTWPSSGVYDVSLFYIPEWICFAVFVAFSCTWLYYARSHLCFLLCFR
jgi:hypothetical protein